MKRTLLAVLTLLSLPIAAAQAGSHVYSVADPVYRNECASCHIAYPPQLLPAESWRSLMSGLKQHFGTDASVDPKAAADIGRYLEQNAGRRRGLTGGAALRISETAWFVKEHNKVQATLYGNLKTGGASNCGACHSRAENGDFSEQSLRLAR